MKKIFFLTLSLCMSSSITCMDIHKAAKRGDLARVRELLNRNPELVNARDDEQFTPLHVAAENGHTDVASLLLDHGAKVDVMDQDDEQFTPLHLAAFCGHTDLASLLLHHRANVNAQNQWQNTPLHFAVSNGHTDVASLLLHWGANVDAQNDEQFTPLHVAALNGHTEVASLLLHRGANVNALLDNEQSNPLRMAAYYGRTKVKQLLKDWPYYQRFIKNQLIAFLMAQHERLGSNSPANVLPNEMLHYIAQFVIPRWPNNTIEQIHKIAEQERQQEHGARNIVRFFLGSGGVLAAAICAVITYRLFRR